MSQPTSPPALSVTRVTLGDFRCYERLRLDLACQVIVLVGENGAGKTNLLEAVSLMAPGRGLRRAALGDLDRWNGGPWSVACRLTGPDGPLDVGTGRIADEDRRQVHLDGASVRSQAALAERVGVTWLTPAMDRLLDGSTGERRRFLDRLVLAIDPGHASRVSLYERRLRERARLLRSGPADPAWLGVIERQMAETGVAIAAARRELIRLLNAEIVTLDSVFPKPVLAVEGDLEAWLETAPALEAEQRLQAGLAASRGLDTPAGGAAIGPHRSTLTAVDRESGSNAAACSTGRQKALLITVILAEAALRARTLGALPIVLLDEVAAHLDARRRDDLFGALVALGAQAWLSGTDDTLFAPLRGEAQFLHVKQAVVRSDE